MLADQSTVLAHFNDHITEHVEHYLQTGVYYDPGIDYSQCEDYLARCRLYRSRPTELSSWMLRRVIRDIAKEWRRPFLHAERSIWNSTFGQNYNTDLTIPRRKYLAPVLTPLLLIAEDKGSSLGWKCVFAHPVEVCHRPTIHTFRFRGEHGHEIFQAFLERCRTSPSHRRALRLDNPHPSRVPTMRGNDAPRIHHPVACQL